MGFTNANCAGVTELQTPNKQTKSQGPTFKELKRRYTAVFKAAWQARHELAGPRRLASERAFLPAVLSMQETPVHPAPRRLMAIVALFCMTALLWATFGKIDIVTVAPGRIIVSERSKVIQPLEAASVKEIHVRDGELVEQNQLLISLDPTLTEAEHVQNTQELSSAIADRLRAERLHKALTGGRLNQERLYELEALCPKAIDAEQDCIDINSFWDQINAEWRDLKSRQERLVATVQTKRSEIEVAQASVIRVKALLESLRQRETDMAALADQGFISQHGLQDRTRDRRDLENELERVKAELKTAQLSLEEAQRDHQAFVASALNSLSQRSRTAQQDIDRLSQDTLKTKQRLRLHELRAPVAGTVQQLAVHTLGGVVTPAQALMVLVPTQQDITAEVMIPNKDIGFVYPGQSARIKVETFNFTRYGTVDAAVAWVSADALTQDPQNPNSASSPTSNGQAPVAYFPAHIRLKQDSLMVDGKQMPLTPGLNITAEIKTGRRSVLDYLLSPIQKTLDESAGER